MHLSCSQSPSTLKPLQREYNASSPCQPWLGVTPKSMASLFFGINTHLCIAGFLLSNPAFIPSAHAAVSLQANKQGSPAVQTEEFGKTGGKPGASDDLPSLRGSPQQRGIAQLIYSANESSNPVTRRNAQWTLGLLALHGIGMPADGTKALQWFARAQRSGHPMASAGLAWCAIDGCGQPPNPPAARPWIAQLSKVDAPRAQYFNWLLAKQLAPLALAQPSNAGQDDMVSEAAQDSNAIPEQALLQRAAQAGSPNAQLELGLALLAQGKTQAALHQFEAAAPRSQSAAINARLLKERMQASAESKKVDSSESFSAQQQWIQAQRYHKGQGVPANYTEALRLYQQAAANGHVGARRMLELIYSRPNPNGSINIGWMQEVANIDPITQTMVIASTAGPSPYRRDPSPLYDLIPASWR